MKLNASLSTTLAMAASLSVSCGDELNNENNQADQGIIIIEEDMSADMPQDMAIDMPQDMPKEKECQSGVYLRADSPDSYIQDAKDRIANKIDICAGLGLTAITQDQLSNMELAEIGGNVTDSKLVMPPKDSNLECSIINQVNERYFQKAIKCEPKSWEPSLVPTGDKTLEFQIQNQDNHPSNEIHLTYFTISHSGLKLDAGWSLNVTYDDCQIGAMNKTLTCDLTNQNLPFDTKIVLTTTEPHGVIDKIDIGSIDATFPNADGNIFNRIDFLESKSLRN